MLILLVEAPRVRWRIKEARKILYGASAPNQPVAPSKPKAEPLTVVPLGLSISEVVER
ncbi:hypothetical protein [Nonomuraea sp. KM88]|uniref:hypothetical protein n=1 Tax=Nonomuraea sp. KM88 TaxID=3457427 RepID=UPI003FCD7F08